LLDDLKFIHEKDAQDALGVAAKQWEQLQQVYDLPELSFRPENIVYAGMGGSALAGLLSISWPGYPVPFEIIKGYDIPKYVSDKTLFIASSYSGNTEETLEALSKAEEKGAFIVVMDSGGKLAEIAKAKNYPYAQLPTGYQPRHTLFYFLKAIITILERVGIYIQEEAVLKQAIETVKKAMEDWKADVPTERNRAKQLALELAGTTPVIYAGPKLFPAAYKWKTNFNENSKNVAWCNVLPEFNHNEFMGWTSHPVDKIYSVIELQSSLEHPRVQKRFKVSNKMLSGRWPEPHVIQVEGEDLLSQLVWTIALGDFVSIYLALLNGVNPTPVEMVEKFKHELEAPDA